MGRQTPKEGIQLGGGEGRPHGYSDLFSICGWKNVASDEIIHIVQMPFFSNGTGTPDTFFRRLENQLHSTGKTVLHFS